MHVYKSKKGTVFNRGNLPVESEQTVIEGIQMLILDYDVLDMILQPRLYKSYLYRIRLKSFE